MFHDLDETLRKVLTDPARPAGLTGIDPESMFITPDRAFAESVGTKNLTVLNLFLHRIKENRELRETTGYPEPGDDPSVRRLPLLRVDCSYVVTTWCKVDVTTDLMTEHKLLGLALQWLSRFPEIPAASPVTPNHPYLAGALARPDLPLPVSMAAQLEPDRVPVDFWTALGIAPRPSFDLTVTIPIVVPARFDEGPPVLVREIDFTRPRPPQDPVPLGKQFRIGGAVTNVLGIPIPGATVRVVGTGAVTTTGADGRFQFGYLDARQYLLEATVTLPGRPELKQSRRVNVPLEDGDDEKYDFGFQV